MKGVSLQLVIRPSDDRPPFVIRLPLEELDRGSGFKKLNELKVAGDRLPGITIGAREFPL